MTVALVGCVDSLFIVPEVGKVALLLCDDLVGATDAPVLLDGLVDLGLGEQWSIVASMSEKGWNSLSRSIEWTCLHTSTYVAEFQRILSRVNRVKTERRGRTHLTLAKILTKLRIHTVKMPIIEVIRQLGAHG